MRLARLLGSLSLISVVAALSASAAELKVGVRNGGESMDPHFSAVGNNIATVRNVFDSLVALDSNLQPIPGLAESWEAIDENTWRFHLRPNVKFHDGSAFDAADVAHSLERIPLAAGPDGGLVTYIRRIAEATVIDDLTIEFRTETPAATLPLDLARLFVIPSEVALDAPTTDFNAGTAAIGTGPFRLVSFTPRGEFVLEPFAQYWGTPSTWDRVSFTEISDDSARVAALLSGGVDFIDYVPAADMPRIQAEADYQVFDSSGIFLFMLYTDYREPTPMVTANDGSALPENPFKNPLVRKALSLSIDRVGIASRIMEDSATPANQFLTPGFFGYNESLPTLDYDPEAARALMAEAGYPDGFKVELYCTADRLPMDGAVCAALGPMLSRIGITVSVSAIPRSVYYTAQSSGEYSLMMNGWSSPTGEGTYFLSSAIHTRDPDRGYGGFNHWYYSNPALDPLIEEAAATIDDDSRRALLEEGMRIASEDSAIIPIVNLNVVWAGRSDLIDFTTRIDQETLAININPKP